MRQIFLDTETTGLSAAEGDRIIEIGCVEMLSRKPTGKDFHHYLNPERDSHPDALAVHGLTTAFLADKPLFANIAPALLEYLKGANVFIHNAAFDTAFLDAELSRLQLPPISSQVTSITDTWALAKSLYPGQQNGLDALCRRLGVDNSGRNLHGALLDAQLLADVYIAMTRGQNSLLDDKLGNEANPANQRQDLSGSNIRIINASADECAAHQAILEKMAKKAPPVWAL